MNMMTMSQWYGRGAASNKRWTVFRYILASLGICVVMMCDMYGQRLPAPYTIDHDTRILQNQSSAILNTKVENKIGPKLSLMNYFKTKYFGQEIWFGGEEGVVLRGEVVNVIEDEGEYFFSVYSSKLRELVELKVIFEVDLLGRLQRNFVKTDTELLQQSQNLNIETAQRTSAMISPLLGGSSSGFGSSEFNLPEQNSTDTSAQDAELLAGVEVTYYDGEARSEKTGHVIVKKRELQLTDGTPIKIRVESI